MKSDMVRCFANAGLESFMCETEAQTNKLHPWLQ